MKLIILRGASGAGKTTLIRKFLNTGPKMVVSADHFFEMPCPACEAHGVDLAGSVCATCNGSGEGYAFDPAKLGEAHGACFRNTIEALRLGIDVIVDNTNTTLVECSPYILLGQAFGVEIEVVELTTPLKTCIARATHGAPPHAITRQFENLSRSTSEWPPFWPPIRREEP